MLSADPVTKICRFRCIERAVTRPEMHFGGRKHGLRIHHEPGTETDRWWFYHVLCFDNLTIPKPWFYWERTWSQQTNHEHKYFLLVRNVVINKIFLWQYLAIPWAFSGKRSLEQSQVLNVKHHSAVAHVALGRGEKTYCPKDRGIL